MNISRIETERQNYSSDCSSSKSSNSASASDLFQNELFNWEKRVKAALEKEQENDNSGNIQMSEKQWRNLMKKIDSAIDTIKGRIKEQAKKKKKQVEQKNPVRNLDSNLTFKDTVNVSMFKAWY